MAVKTHQDCDKPALSFALLVDSWLFTASEDEA